LAASEEEEDGAGLKLRGILSRMAWLEGPSAVEAGG